MSIEKHRFSDSGLSATVDFEGWIIKVHDCITGHDFGLSKGDAYALAKHFCLIDEWVSVDDRLPDPVFDFVLAYADGAMSTIGYSSSRGFYEVHPIKTQIVIAEITHWKPLPQPPKGTDK